MDHRFVVFGATGMFGQMAASRLRRLGDVVCISRTGPCPFVVEDGEAGVRRVLATAPGSLVVNAIGATKTADISGDPLALARAIRINAEFPHVLTAAAEEARCRVVHVSTDGVFSRNRGVVSEADTPDPDDWYGMTKLLGETSTDGALTVRCSIVGPDGRGARGLWAWLAGQPSGAAVDGFTDHWWSGSTTRQLADLCGALADPDAFAAARRWGPVRHFAPNPAITKYELLCRLRDVLRPDIVVRPVASGRAVCRLLTGGAGLPEVTEAGARSWRDVIADGRFADRA